MVRFLFALVFILLFQLSKASCQDKNWIKIPGNFNGDQRFFNCKHIVRGKTTAVVWIKKVLCKKNFDELTTKSTANFKWLIYDEDLTQERMDFKDKSTRHISTYSFLDGVPVNTFFSNKNDAVILDESGFQFDDELLAVKKYLHMKN